MNNCIICHRNAKFIPKIFLLITFNVVSWLNIGKHDSRDYYTHKAYSNYIMHLFSAHNLYLLHGWEKGDTINQIILDIIHNNMQLLCTNHARCNYCLVLM